jgi:hypothetical protein
MYVYMVGQDNIKVDLKEIDFDSASLEQSLSIYVFRLSQRQNCMNSPRADSRVNCLKTSDVSETHSVSILRERVY